MNFVPAATRPSPRRSATMTASPLFARTLLTVSILVAALLPALFVTACGSDSGNDSQALQDREWRAVRIAGVASVLPTTKGSATATFKDGRVTGSGTVNHFFASYELGSGNAIRIWDLGATEMAGPPEAMAQEAAYFEALQHAASYEVSETSLVLRASDGATLIEFEPIPPAPLTGTLWRATLLGPEPTDPDTPVTELKITAVFGTDGTLTGNASVNQYSTTYTISDGRTRTGLDGGREDGSTGGKMTISERIATTKMAGPPELMAIEAAYLAALPRTATYEIKGDALWLRDPAGVLLVQFVAGSAE